MTADESDAITLGDRVFDTLPNQVAVVDSDGVIVDTNAAWNTVSTGSSVPSVGDTTGVNYLAVCDAANDPDAAAAAAGIRAVLTGEESFYQEYACHTPAERRWFMMRVTPIEWRGERHALIVHTDITERHVAEQAVADSNERLRTVANVLSHDLRNPLTVALGRAELMDGDHAAAVTDALERMRTILDDVGTLARMESIERTKPVDLGEVARSAWDHVVTEEASLSVPEDAVVLADESLLTQLLENLFRNAVKHGGEDCHVAVGTTDEGFYVEDDGDGLPATQDQVFETGFTTGDGSGLGLSIVRRIAEAHGWTVSAAEGSEGGARFAFADVDRPP